MILVATTGASNANSLCDRSEARTYILASGLSITDWDDLSAEEQDNALILAGIALKNLIWDGFPCYMYQAMPFPRWRGDEEEFTADTAQNPETIKQAQALLAYDVIWRGLQGRTSPATGPATDAIKSLSLFGDISISFRDSAEIPLRNGITLAGLMRAGYSQIYLLLSEWATEIGFLSDWLEEEPDLLDEIVAVVPTT